MDIRRQKHALGEATRGPANEGVEHNIAAVLHARVVEFEAMRGPKLISSLLTQD